MKNPWEFREYWKQRITEDRGRSMKPTVLCVVMYYDGIRLDIAVNAVHKKRNWICIGVGEGQFR